jgi:hypothetical protein
VQERAQKAREKGGGEINNLEKKRSQDIDRQRQRAGERGRAE